MKMGILDMKSIKVLLFPLLTIFLFGCSSKEPIKLNQLQWLLGNREVVVDNQIIIETWEQENDSMLIGKSFVANQYDTALTETIQIVQRENIIYYIPLVFNQNEGAPVLFELISDNPEQLVFENTEHDFPNRICYYKEGKNINAWIEGGGKKIDFYFMTTK